MWFSNVKIVLFVLLVAMLVFWVGYEARQGGGGEWQPLFVLGVVVVIGVLVKVWRRGPEP